MERTIQAAGSPAKLHQSEHSVADLRETLTPGPHTRYYSVNLLALVSYVLKQLFVERVFWLRLELDRVVDLHFTDRPNAELHTNWLT